MIAITAAFIMNCPINPVNCAAFAVGLTVLLVIYKFLSRSKNEIQTKKKDTPVKTHEIIIGIDVGTTNFALSMWNEFEGSSRASIIQN